MIQGRAHRTWSWLAAACVLLLPLSVYAVTFTVGVPESFNTGNTYFPGGARIDDTHVLLVYGDNGAAKAAVATIDGTDLAVGTEYQFCGSDCFSTKAAMLDSTHAVIVYETANSAYAVVATLSGSSMTFGSAVSFSSSMSTNSDAIQVTALDSTHIAILYVEEVANPDPFSFDPPTYTNKLVAATVSGSSITFGSPTTLSADGAAYIAIVAMDDTHFIAMYNTYTPYLVAASMSGTTITLGTAISISGYTSDHSLATLDSTHAVLTYRSNSGDRGAALVVTRSGTTLTAGTAQYVTTGRVYFPRVGAMSASRLAFVYRDQSGDTHIHAKELTVESGVVQSDSDVLVLEEEVLNTHTYVIGMDAYSAVVLANNKAAVVADASAPILSSVVAIPTATGASITWTSDKPASSRVVYGPTEAYGTQTDEADTAPRVTSHSITLASLLPCTQYYFRVQSTDAYASTTTATGSTFSTPGCSGAAPIEAQTGATLSNAAQQTLTLSGAYTLSLTVPAASTPYNATFQIRRIEKNTFMASAGSPSGYSQVGSVFHLLALSGATVSVTSFANALTITLSYNDVDISGLDESALRIYRYDGSAWYALPSTVDTVSNIVTATTTQFSDFSIFGAPPVVVTNNSSPAQSGGGGGGGGRRGGPGRGGTAASFTQATLHTVASTLHSASSRTPQTMFETRVCLRVLRWFRGNDTMLGRVNWRLEHRFGFVCSAQEHAASQSE